MSLNTATAENTAAVENTVQKTFPREVSYRFNEVEDPTTKVKSKRPSVVLKVPVPSLPGIISIIQAGATAKQKADAGQTVSDEEKKAIKSLEYLIEVTGDVVQKEVRGFVNDNLNASQDTIPWNKYTFEEIANMPAGIRGASSIAKELWDKFAKSYVEVMVAFANVTAEVAAARAGVFLQKFRPLTGNPERKTIIENLMATLAVYMDKSADKDKEELTPILEFLSKKADELKAEDTVVTKDALGF